MVLHMYEYKYKWVYICYAWIQIQTLLLTWLEVTEKACPLLAGSQNISFLAFVNYIQVKVLDCDFSVWLSRLDSKSSSAQANNNHSIARRPFRGNPQPSRTPPHRCYLPPTEAPDISAPRVPSRTLPRAPCCTLPRVPRCTLPPPTWPPGCTS